ncbi:hypothetical protein AB0K60_31470 [Thermopolyspora sp. NPDC052614]|uniref:hypothetical protein n=1 Tax=Thermopolyspora sp. NPDC052614 TaxID=3155682 RepID=UPI003425F255
MSGSSGLAVSPREGSAAARTRPRAWMLSPYALPVRAVRLWVRCLLPLSIWFSVGQLLRFGLTVAGSELSHGSGREWRLAGVMFLLAVMVMLTMIVTIGMLHSLRGALVETRARREEGSEEDEPFFGGVERAIVAFATVYLAWEWYVDDARQFADADMERYAEQYDQYQAALLNRILADAEGKPPPPAPTPPEAGTNLIMDVRTALIFMAVTFVLRYVVALLYARKGGRALALTLAFCELAFTFYGLAVVLQTSSMSSGWLGERAFTHWWNDTWANLEAAIPGWETFWSTLDEIRPHVGAVVVQTLIWLALTVLVFGAYSEDARDLIRGTRLERAGTLVEQRTHALTRRSLGHLTVRLGWDKWPPVLNALRFIVRGGPSLFAMTCLGYVAIAIAAGYAERGAYYLIGTAHRQLDWEVYQIPVRFAVDLLSMTLLLCLMAAAFDLSATRQRLNSSASEASADE